MPTALQIFLSYLLILGLGLGVGSLICASLVRFLRRRRLLGLLAALGFSAFLTGLLLLTPPGLRLYNCYFWLFAATIIGGAIGAVTVRNVFHAALLLILCLFGVSGFFILTNAEFLAAVQIIIYIGGIMVLFLFGIMVSQNIIGTEIRQNTPQAPWAALAAAVLFMFMFVSGLYMSFPPQEAAGTYVLASNTQSLGWSLMATYTLPFEVASLLLLVSMMGAIVLVRKD
jgi:NADH-quinone oxidoreductase subunit J